MQEIETVDKHCKHPDCIYRKRLDQCASIYFCAYIIYKRKPRGCRISECDKYRRGNGIKPRITKDKWIEWVEEDDDIS